MRPATEAATMGLTVYYTLRTRNTGVETAMKRVEAMRQLALDLPFDRVADAVTHLAPEECEGGLERYRHTDRRRFGFLLESSTSMRHGEDESYQSVTPIELIGFYTVPGQGAESAFIGLARYPDAVDIPGPPRPGVSTRPAGRTVKVGEAGWSNRSYCKTQYAGNPRYGGVANFLKTHVALITLLDRIGELPGVSVEMNDDGGYGPHNFSPDWREANEEGRERTLEHRDGLYDLQALVTELGTWNERVAAVAGAVVDKLPSEGTTVAPITEYEGFEHLELRGQRRLREDTDALLRSLSEASNDAREAME